HVLANSEFCVCINWNTVLYYFFYDLLDKRKFDYAEKLVKHLEIYQDNNRLTLLLMRTIEDKNFKELTFFYENFKLCEVQKIMCFMFIIFSSIPPDNNFLKYISTDLEN